MSPEAHPEADDDQPVPAAPAAQRGPRDRHEHHALVTRRSQTIAVGETSSNSVFATAAPNWTDRIPTSTSQTGESRAAHR